MSGRLCRKMILGLHIMHCIMLYTHMIMHYAAGKFWPLVPALPGGVARGARSTYQTDFEPWCLHWQHIPILATMCEKLHGLVSGHPIRPIQIELLPLDV